MTRRDFLAAGVATGIAASPVIALGGQTSALPSDAPLPVPQNLPTKLANTAREGISMATHEAHLKLWQGYANKTNEISARLRDLEATTKGANQIYSEMRALKANFPFAYGGYINHEIYFDSLGGDGTAVPAKVRELIEASFGGYEAWTREFKATGIAARGWVFMAVDHRTGRLANLLGDSQDTYPIWHHTPILALDVYEHAYYLDFQTNRGAYIDAYVRCIDWTAVERRLLR